MAFCSVCGYVLVLSKSSVDHQFHLIDLKLFFPFERNEFVITARAIENQCYVLAAAQYGKHNGKRVSFGHSLVSGLGSTMNWISACQQWWKCSWYVCWRTTIIYSYCEWTDNTFDCNSGRGSLGQGGRGCRWVPNHRRRRSQQPVIGTCRTSKHRYGRDWFGLNRFDSTTNAHWSSSLQCTVVVQYYF